MQLSQCTSMMSICDITIEIELDSSKIEIVFATVPLSGENYFTSNSLVRLAGDHLYGKLLFTWLSLVMSMMVSFCAVLFPTRCLG